MLQSLLRFLLPTQCGLCDSLTEVEGALCPACWAQTQFIVGAKCHCCGAPLVGHAEVGDYCDDCIALPKPWDAGRAAFVYSGAGRKLVLSLKHGDRLDLVPTLAPMLCRAGADLWPEADVIVPVPLHWTRLVKRRFNQAAVLARAAGRRLQIPVDTDALIRAKRTLSTKGLSLAERQLMLKDSIAPNPSRPKALKGKRVVLIDDVMTTGSTLAQTAIAAHISGASRVCVVTLARAVKHH